jgi:hypothetical protein
MHVSTAQLIMNNGNQAVLLPDEFSFRGCSEHRRRAKKHRRGRRGATIRSLVYIGLAGPGVDERAFNQLRQMRAEHGGLTLEEFKRVLREQFFGLLLDRGGALAAIPKMLPADADARTKMLAAIRTVDQRRVDDCAPHPTGAVARLVGG